MRIKDRKKFFRFILLLCIFVFTVSCGVEKIMSSSDSQEKTKEMVRDVIKIEVSDNPKEEKIKSEVKATDKNEIEEEEIIDDGEMEGLEETSSISSQKEMVADEKYRYVKNNALFVYNDFNKQKKIDTLREGTKVKVLSTKEVSLKNNKKEKMLSVEYKKDLKVKNGWISQNGVVYNLKDTLSNNWKNLDLVTDHEKINFPLNPRRDVKGIYLNRYTISSSKKMDKLIKLAKDTEINAFVIDVKDDNGELSFEMPISKKYGIVSKKNYPIKDIESFMKKLKENNIYAIARIVSFKDPTYAKANPDKVIITRATGKPYTNSDGIIWVSAHDRNLWNYNVEVAEIAAKNGFNEIQFDYVRFPASNGGKLDSKLDYRNMKNESKPETIQKYLKFAQSRLRPLNVYLSADVYGQVGTFPDDMGIGQYWESISKVVDYICPMMYPSHYGNGAYGIAIPDANPYKTIYNSARDSVNRNYNITSPAQIRPWIQAFTASWVKGHINYNELQIREQIKALNELGIKEYLLWSPSNNYKITR